MTVEAAILEVARGSSLIAAPTTDSDDAWSWPRRPAMALAKQLGTRLILADISTRSLWTPPYGTGGAGADRGAPYSDGTTTVSRQELGLLGRSDMLAQLDEARYLGVEAEAWLSDRPGVAALDRLLELFPVDVLVIPPLDEPSFLDRLRGDDIEAVRRRMVGHILLVADADGTLRVDRP